MSEWTPDEATTRLIRKYAMQNALEYDGKGQTKSVQGRILGEVAELRQHAKHLFGILGPAVTEANELWMSGGADAVREVLESEAPDALEKRVKERRDGLPDLPNATKGEVVLRFAPNPNGPLTLGHSRGVVINSQYAEMYDGKVILRFDDTDTKIKRPDLNAYGWIKDDFTWLSGKQPDIVIEASARMSEYLDYASKFISDGHMYVCQCTAEAFRGLRIAQEECECRANSNLENKQLWKKMNDPEGGMMEGSAVVRVRTDMTHKNPALRDWPAWRIQTAPHPKVRDTYRVWPLLDFQSAVEDHLQGVTHIIRGKDLMDSTRKQNLLYEMVGWAYPETLYWGRVKVHEFGGFSTSQMKIDIANGLYTGWDDPRLPTVSALRRRGFSSESLRKFWVELSLTQKDIAVPLDTLISHNSSIIDEDSPRLSFIQSPVKITLDCGDTTIPKKVKIPRHPLHPEKGMREWVLNSDSGLEVIIEKDDFEECLSKDGLLRLKDFADIQIFKDFTGKITSLNRTDKRPIIHWLASGIGTPCTLLKGVDGGTPGPDGLVKMQGLLEQNEHPVGSVVQLERNGFAKIEEPDDKLIQSMVWTHS